MKYHHHPMQRYRPDCPVCQAADAKQHGFKLLDGIPIKYLCQPCPECKAKLEAAEGMARTLERFVDYYAGSKKSHLGNGQACKSHGEMEAALALWQKAGKGEG